MQLLVISPASAGLRLAPSLAPTIADQTWVPADSLDRALARLAAERFDAVLVDLAFPDAAGIEILRALRPRHSMLLALAYRGDVAEAVAAIKAGACDYLPRTDDSLARLPEVVQAAVQDYAAWQSSWEAERARQIQDEFVSAIAHELRTPLTPLKGFVQLMARVIAREDVPVDRRRFARNLALIETQVNRLDRLISQLLDTWRIQIGDVSLRPEPVDLNQVAAEVVAALQAQLGPDARHRLLLEAAAPSLVGLWDSERISQVLTQLIENAIKYSPDGGRIVIRLWAEDGQARISIHDEGIGIPPDQQSTIFQPFVRGRNAPPPRFGGLGLGLAISREMVERHGGRIWVESRGIAGSGTIAQVSLPLRWTEPPENLHQE